MTDWKTRALCATSPMADYFTAEATDTITPGDITEMRTAAAFLCQQCPVKQQCLSDAERGRLDLDDPIRPFGILGGLFYDGTRHPPTDPLLRDQLRRMVADGICDAVMAERLGITPGQVRSIRNSLGLPSTVTRRRIPLRPTFKHGTKAGYHCHIRRDEAPCEDCRQAKNAYNRAAAARRRAAA